jgi:hypothetical protein
MACSTATLEEAARRAALGLVVGGLSVVSRRCSGGSMCTDVVGRSLGEVMAWCWRGQGGTSSSAVVKLPMGASARSMGGEIWRRGFQQVGPCRERGG